MIKPINQRRRCRASSIVETVAGLILIIPLMLFFVDIIGVLLCQTANNALAKEAARAAAEATTSANAQTAAQNIVTQFYDNNTSMFTGGANFVTATFSYNASNSGVVIVQTQMTCYFPFPIPGVPSPNDKQATFGATATEPIVALLPGQ